MNTDKRYLLLVVGKTDDTAYDFRPQPVLDSDFGTDKLVGSIPCAAWVNACGNLDLFETAVFEDTNFIATTADLDLARVWTSSEAFMFMHKYAPKLFNDRSLVFVNKTIAYGLSCDNDRAKYGSAFVRNGVDLSVGFSHCAHLSAAINDEAHRKYMKRFQKKIT